MKITFYIQADAAPDRNGNIKERVPIYIRFNDGRKFDLRTKTGQVINPKLWDADKWKPGSPKTNVRDAEQKRECNLVAGALKKIDRELTELYNGIQDQEITMQWLKSYLQPEKSVGAAPGQLIPYFEYYETARAGELKTASVVKLNVVKHLLERFQDYKGAVLLVKDVDADFKRDFFAFSKAQGYAPNTTARNFKFIKTVCYHAEANGVLLSPQLKHITVKTVPVDKIFLTPEELDMIAAKKLKVDYLDNARDWLLISCETGQRVSDFLRFTADMIRRQAGKTLIEFTQKKTGKIMTIPLSKKVLTILEKREGNFPRQISDQRYNEYIKDVCKLAGLTYKVKGGLINEHQRKESGMFEKYRLVTSHIGRRSFATNNYGRIPTSLLIAATGHSTEQMFLAYIGKSNADRALELAEYF